MQPGELQSLLTSFAADRLSLLRRHEAGARVVSHYDFNNAYQYVIAREETQLSWLQSALAEAGVSSLPSPAAEIPVPPAPKPARKVEASAYRGILDDDARRILNAHFPESIRDAFASKLAPTPNGSPLGGQGTETMIEFSTEKRLK